MATSRQGTLCGLYFLDFTEGQKPHFVSQETFPEIKLTAVAGAEETIRVVVDDREVFDVIINIEMWVAPNLVYM